MKAEHVLLICAGSIFLLLLVVYLIIALEQGKINRRNHEILLKSYSKENLRKMEYDVAFYEKNVFLPKFNNEDERQVTVDDVLMENEDMSRLAEEAVFATVESERSEEVRGNFNPAE